MNILQYAVADDFGLSAPELAGIRLRLKASSAELAGGEGKKRGRKMIKTAEIVITEQRRGLLVAMVPGGDISFPSKKVYGMNIVRYF